MKQKIVIVIVKDGHNAEGIKLGTKDNLLASYSNSDSSGSGSCK
jgi:hypothetical protein